MARIPKPQVIESIELFNATPDGPDFYKVGGRCGNGKIADITEKDGVYRIYNEKDEMVMEVRNNWPVVVRYAESGAVI